MSTLSKRTPAPTLESVAARAGVSRATAGRALSGSTSVKKSTRQTVELAAAELGYVTNYAARSLMTGRSDAVAFVVFETEEMFFSDPFFATILHGVHQAVSERHRQLMFIIATSEEDRHKLKRFAAGGHIDGVMLGSFHGPDPLPTQLRELGVPIAQCGRPHVEDPGLAFVDADNVGGARRATRHLLRTRRNIVTIAGPADMTPGIDRLNGFYQELAKSWEAAGQASPALDRGEHSPFTIDGGRTAMHALLDRFPDLDGVFAANDSIAVGAIQALHERGRRVPDDVGVVGFDDVPLAMATQPRLTTVRQPLVQMGRTIADLVLDQIEGIAGPRQIVVPTELRVRESA